MSKKTKEDLLKHYMQKEPTAFIQFDVFSDPKHFDDDIIVPDRDGYCALSDRTYELMTGVYDVRILIRPHVSKDKAIGSLLKVISWIQCRDILEKQKGKIKEDEEMTKERDRKRNDMVNMVKTLMDNGYSEKVIRELTTDNYTWEMIDGKIVLKEKSIDEPSEPF